MSCKTLGTVAHHTHIEVHLIITIILLVVLVRAVVVIFVVLAIAAEAERTAGRMMAGWTRAFVQVLHKDVVRLANFLELCSGIGIAWIFVRVCA